MNDEWTARMHYNVDKRNSVYTPCPRCDAMRCDAITTRNKTPLPTHQNIHFNKMHH